MKKLTLLLAALSLIVGALFLTACSEPMSSETDDGLAAPPYGSIAGRAYYWDDGGWEPVNGTLVNNIKLWKHDGDISLVTSTTCDADGYFDFGLQDWYTTYSISGVYGFSYSGTTGTFYHTAPYESTTWVTLYLTED